MSDLTALILPLASSAAPAPLHGRGWLYHQLQKVAPELHDDGGPMPFTVGVGESEGGPWLRFTFLDAALHAALAPALDALPEQSLRLGATPYRIRQVLRSGHPWAAQSSYADLLAPPHSPDAGLEFASPTFFRRQGNNYPLPEPRLAFGSLAARWNAFAPEAVPEDVLHTLGDRLTFRRLRLSSQSAAAHDRTVGCLGHATYHLPRATPEEARWLTALARFAFFSGVGAKTTLGFGRVRAVIHSPA